MSKELKRRMEFKHCPREECGGLMFHDSTHSHCIRCGLVLSEKCCYKIEGNEIIMVAKEK